MFGNLGVHVIDFPSGRFGFVGTLPAALGNPVTASRADIMAGRAFTAPSGEVLTMAFPSFETRDAAVAYATARGITVRSPKS